MAHTIKAEVETEVAVVGAGLSGLVAARELVRSGKEMLMPEARNRVGGRTYTQYAGGVPLEMGGQWIGPEQDRVLALPGVPAEMAFSRHHRALGPSASGDRRSVVFLWLLAPLVGTAVMSVPLWYNLQPGQDPLFNLMPILLPALILVCVAYMLYVQQSKPQLLTRAGTIMLGKIAPEESSQTRSHPEEEPGAGRDKPETTRKEGS